MSKSLTVIIGAGASFDCVDQTAIVQEVWRPPLVQDLFHRRFNRILERYPKAREAAEEIRIRLAQGNISIETLLHELKDSSQRIFKSEYLQVPFYLQELFLEVSRNFLTPGEATKFSTFIRNIERSKFDRVLFLTVNYDLFLEGALGVIYNYHFGDMNAYIPQDYAWRLVKLHGSVNWGRKFLNDSDPAGLIGPKRDTLELLLDREPMLSPDCRILMDPLQRVVDGRHYYPAMVVPVTGKAGFMCPKDHVNEATEILSHCENFLVIGFSALDSDVLDLLSRVGKVKHLKIVNGSKEAAGVALDRISATNSVFSLEKPDHALYHLGFKEFVGGGDAKAFLLRI